MKVHAAAVALHKLDKVDKLERTEPHPRHGKRHDVARAEPDGGDLEVRLAEAGLRSPATVNAFRRFANLVLSNLEGPARDGMADAIAAVAEEAGRVSAQDGRPYGHSVEHAIKKLLNDPGIRKAIRAAAAAPAEEPASDLPLAPGPVDDAEPVDGPATLPVEPEPTAMRLDVTF